MPNRLDFPKKRGLGTRIVVYVPSTEKDKPVSTREFNRRVRETQMFLSKEFGGSTRVSGVGTFIDNSNLIREDVAKVESFADSKVYRRVDKKLEKWLMKKRKEWNQFSVGYEYEKFKRPEGLHLIEAKKLKQLS